MNILVCRLRKTRQPKSQIISNQSLTTKLVPFVRQHRRALQGYLWPYGDWVGFHAAAPCSLLNDWHPRPVNAYAPARGRKHQSGQFPSSLRLARRSSTCRHASGYRREKWSRILRGRRYVSFIGRYPTLSHARAGGAKVAGPLVPLMPVRPRLLVNRPTAAHVSQRLRSSVTRPGLDHVCGVGWV
jgi:hypothetical protein